MHLQTLAYEMNRIRSHPLVNKSIPVYGNIYDVKSGRLIEVPEASAIGGGAPASRRKSAKADKASGRRRKPKAAPAKGRKPAKAVAADATKARKPGQAAKAATSRGRKSGKAKAA